MLLPLLLWKRESLQNNTRNWHFIGLSILVVVVLILVSGSLTACGSALIGSGFFYFFMLKKNSFKRFLYILVVIFTFIFMMYYALIPTELRELIALKSHQSFVIGSGRWEAWSGALESFHKRPVLGYGFGTYDLLFERFNLTSDLRFGEVSSHNSYLDLLTGNGLIGVIAFLPLFLSLLSLVFKKGVNREDPEITLLAIALSGSVFAYLFTTSMFESSFFSAGNIFTFPFWLLVVTLNKVKNTNLNRPAIRNLICAE